MIDVFECVYFDIIGGCNAKCPFCVTARTTFGRKIESISVVTFERVIDRLFALEVIDKSTVINLFNWGEPILHPDLNGILSVLNQRGLRAGISTNGSKKTNFDVSTRGFEHFTFSVPGWSQASYDKIHGLRFDRIISNIDATIGNMRSTGFEKDFHLSYHVYQFNAFDELRAAQEWCAERGIKFQPYYAFVNDYQPAKDLLKNALPQKTKDEFSRKLFLHYIDDLVKEKPADWACPQWDERLTLTHTGDVLLCCVVPDAHPAGNLGSVFDLSREQLLSRKKSSKECTDCLDCGVAYWVHNAQPIQLPPLAQEKRGSVINMLKRLMTKAA
jgi:MoaA/NifB/PqqE/SkfB family radical SAM enzyme